MPKQQQKTQPSNFDITQFTFLYDNVLVKALRAEGQVVTIKATGEKVSLQNPQQYDDKPEFGVIIALGEGKLLDNGTIVPPKVKVGDKIFFGKYSTEQTRSVGQDYFIIREEDIKAVL